MQNFVKLVDQVCVFNFNLFTMYCFPVYLLITRLNKIEKMEDMLIVWMQDLIHKNVPLSGLAVRQQALAFYEFLNNQLVGSSNETFVASRGWFDRFKSRFSLHNVSFSGEKASADQEAAALFPAKLKALIEEKGYLYDQIFNCDETGLNWKKMPNRTYLTKNEEAINSDPIMTRSLRFNYDCEVALKSYEELYKDLSRREKQKTLTQYFNKV